MQNGTMRTFSQASGTAYSFDFERTTDRIASDTLIVTLDVDWAPDFVINFVADMLVAARVKATWFVTHHSPAVDRLRSFPALFDLGIHPNFFARSSHGSSMEDVVRHCLEIVPEAVSMRTHGLFQSSELLHYVSARTRIETDVSLFLPGMAGLRSLCYRAGGSLFQRIPYYWEDDVEMEQQPARWTLESLVPAQPGLKVLDFHPIHIYLNSADMAPYERVKRAGLQLSDVKPAVLDREIHRGPGTRTLFEEVLSYLRGGPSMHIGDLQIKRPATTDEVPSP